MACLRGAVRQSAPNVSSPQAPQLFERGLGRLLFTSSPGKHFFLLVCGFN